MGELSYIFGWGGAKAPKDLPYLVAVSGQLNHTKVVVSGGTAGASTGLLMRDVPLSAQSCYSARQFDSTRCGALDLIFGICTGEALTYIDIDDPMFIGRTNKLWPICLFVLWGFMS